MDRRALGFFVLKISVCFGLYADDGETLDLIYPTLAEKVEDFMQALNVPGAALGIIHNGKVFLDGYGLRDIEHVLPVTPETIFPVGSLSKPFTTFLIGQLVDEGWIDWDDAVSERIPYFKLEDPITTYQITIRDYLTHLSGYPTHDAAWFGRGYSRVEMVKRMKFLSPSLPLRSQFMYQTGLGYMVAAHAVECAMEKTWEELCDSYIFQPLGMERTHASITQLEGDENRSIGYRESNKEILSTKYMDVACINPGGGLNSTVSDLMQFVQVLLKKGEGFLSLETFNEVVSPQVVSNIFKGNRFGVEKEISMEAYGLGWFILSYKGEKLIFHGGNIGGFSSVLMFFPRRELGIVILSNKDHSIFPYILGCTIADDLLNLQKTDWLDKVLQFLEHDGTDKPKQQKGGEESRYRHKEPSHPLHEYQGTYTHPGYGEVEVRMQNSDLTIHIAGGEVPLNHWHYDIFKFGKSCDLYPFEGIKARFEENFHGDIHSISVSFGLGAEEISFIKEKDRLLFSKNYLDRFVGDYNYHGFSFIISREEGQLVVNALGQPPFFLEPEKDALFKVIGYEGNIVQFLINEENLITAVQLVQSNNSVYTAYKN